MSIATILYRALISPDALRASGPEDLADVLTDALRDAGRLDDEPAATCRSLFQLGTGRLVRCEGARKHPLAHTAGAQTWTDAQAAGVLRDAT